MPRLISSLLKRITHTASGLPRKPPIVVPLIFWATLYAIFHRTPQEFLGETFPIAAFLAFISYSFFVMRWSLFGHPKLNVHLFLLPILYLPILIFVLTVMYWGIWVAMRDSYVWLEHQSPPRGFFVALIGVLVVVVGYILFLLRLRARFFFGLTEALTGLLIALHNVPANADPVLWSSQIFLVILTGGVLLVVQGFDNMRTGLKSESRDGFLEAFDKTEYGALSRSLRGDDK
ncbi:hypothetical protein [Rhodoferax sediminis]|uniref:Uncharacterized protein n=1 Tax=Rhodoferax sediminis TaxID=2509614 RepID=A0A515DBA1_9BURK|nr:hypothetical protein [Rhodoferax sediminis]QDL37698.1 hypothetical protein EUB48_10765 [Rhodoferax sediminis]